MMTRRDSTISFIGAGRVGAAVAALLRGAGLRVIGITSRNIGSAERAAKLAGGDVAYSDDICVFVEESDIVIITTVDAAIAGVAREIAEQCEVRRNQVFMHMSGSHQADILAPLRDRGSAVVSMHPLQSIATAEEGIVVLKGSLYAIEGDGPAVECARMLVDALEGRPFLLDRDKKALYHLAAVIACNYFVTIVDTAGTIFERIGIERSEGLPGLLKLVRGTLGNIEKLGTAGALTGPIARGDVETVELHMNAIRAAMPELEELYRVLGAATIDLALQKGTIDIERAKELKSVII